MKRKIFGFSSYPDNVLRPVEVISYDGNKYCVVRFVDPTQVPQSPGLDWDERGFLHQKIGYVSSRPFDLNYKGYRPINDLDLWLLAGNDRRDYKSRVRRTRWAVRGGANEVYGTQVQAVARAQALAREQGRTIVVLIIRSSGHSFIYGHHELTVFESGNVMKTKGLGGRARTNYLRGAGKTSVQRRRWSARARSSDTLSDVRT